MRKFKTRRRFRLLFVLAGALMLLAALAPNANAQCTDCLIRYYNFEGAPTGLYPVNLDSHTPAAEVGSTFRAFLTTGPDPTMAATMDFPSGNTSAQPGLPLNVAAGDPDDNLTSLGIHRSQQHDLFIDIPMFSAVGIYDVASVSFAVSRNGNGYEFVSLLYSIDGGATFTQIGDTQTILTGGAQVITFTVPAGTTIDQPTLILRLAFTGGHSNGNDLQVQIDNIQVNGTIVPEPATVVGGLLGVLGLGWQQRRRLIRHVRFRRA